MISYICILRYIHTRVCKHNAYTRLYEWEPEKIAKPIFVIGAYQL